MFDGASLFLSGFLDDQPRDALSDQDRVLDLGLDAVDQVVVGITEGLHALVFERAGDPV